MGEGVREVKKAARGARGSQAKDLARFSGDQGRELKRARAGHEEVDGYRGGLEEPGEDSEGSRELGKSW